MSCPRFLSSVALALCLTACATAARREAPPLSDEARRLAALLTLRRDEFSDLRTLADVTLRRGSDARRLSGVLLVKPPAALRFEALSPFGQPFLLLVISAGTLTSYDVARNQVLTGPVTARAAARWLGVPLGAEDLVGLLIGRIAPPRGLEQAEILPADADGPSIRLTGRDQSERVWMDFETGAVRKAEIDGGRIALVVVYHRPPGSDLPDEIQARAPAAAFDATVRYRDPALATGVPAERFELSPPPGANLQRFH